MTSATTGKTVDGYVRTLKRQQVQLLARLVAGEEPIPQGTPAWLERGIEKLLTSFVRWGALEYHRGRTWPTPKPGVCVLTDFGRELAAAACAARPADAAARVGGIYVVPK